MLMKPGCRASSGLVHGSGFRSHGSRSRGVGVRGFRASEVQLCAPHPYSCMCRAQAYLDPPMYIVPFRVCYGFLVRMLITTTKKVLHWRV